MFDNVTRSCLQVVRTFTYEVLNLKGGEHLLARRKNGDTAGDVSLGSSSRISRLWRHHFIYQLWREAAAAAAVTGGGREENRKEGGGDGEEPPNDQVNGCRRCNLTMREEKEKPLARSLTLSVLRTRILRAYLACYRYVRSTRVQVGSIGENSIVKTKKNM